MSVEINLDVVRKPRLYLSLEHPAKLIVIEVKIIVFALCCPGNHLNLFGIPVRFYSRGFTELHGGEGADKSGFVRILFINLPLPPCQTVRN